MARPRSVTGGALAAAALLTLTVPSAAQGLRALHVEALSMRADRTHVQLGQVFHLAIHVRVRENVAALDELVVPDVGTMKLEGDERHVTRSPGRTDVVETLTLEATTPGTFTFNAAYLDATDARTGKPSRFSANPVRVVVDKPGPLYVTGYANIWRFMIGVMVAGSVLMALAVVAIARVGRRRRERPAVTVAQPIVAPVAAPPRMPRDDVTDALRAYRSAPAHDALMRLRAALFVAAGVTAGATLRDAVGATSDRRLQAAVTAAEHTAFGPANARDGTSVELIAATDEWLFFDANRGRL